jgi:hypothetical protein
MSGAKSIAPRPKVNDVAYCDSGSTAENLLFGRLVFSGRKENVCTGS